MELRAQDALALIMELTELRYPTLHAVLAQVADEIKDSHIGLEDIREQLVDAKNEIDDFKEQLEIVQSKNDQLRIELEQADQELNEINEAAGYVTAHCEYCPGVDKPHGPFEEEQADKETEAFVDGLNKAMAEVNNPTEEQRTEHFASVGEVVPVELQSTLAEHFDNAEVTITNPAIQNEVAQKVSRGCIEGFFNWDEED